MAATPYDVAIEIGGMTVVVRTDSSEFARLLRDRYGPFVLDAGRPAEATGGGRDSGEPEAFDHLAHGESCPAGDRGVKSSFHLDVELLPPGIMSDAEEARVRLQDGRWVMERGDFRAECDPECRRGWIRQSANPYSIDAVMRMLHSLMLARNGGFLVHAASAIRNGRAFLFAGVSGAGKTTISRLAPPDVVLLTDEISYVRKGRSQGSEAGSHEQGFGIQDSGFREFSTTPDTRRLAPETCSSLTPGTRYLAPAFEAFGTPFAGELARIGKNIRAPIAALYLLGQGPANTIYDVSQAEAVRALLQSILFFSHDDELVRLVFQSALQFVNCVPVRRLVFAPDPRVWELVG